jgi:NADH-quinone oxidoreductase subunit D
VKDALNYIEPKVAEYEQECTNNEIFKIRTVGVGTIDRDLALEVGLTGPVLRASGVDHDLRRDAPFAAYDEVKVKVATATAGDCYARYVVRMAEMKDSIRIVRELIDNIPEGPICALKPVKAPNAVRITDGQTYFAIETPRGELGTYVIGGGDAKGASPYRLKIRPPSLHAMAVLPYVLVGHQVADVVAILGSLDPIMGEVDR